ncbi:uncharacterized protein H6S33_010968 [Morchella sextelata]|uniref:uncharacterized protein n=1 Tax=Morchella sextelata TaxID=1174677 RepID=UPI001D055CDF|nr:uncharacterized protein H6S33_010968 [Morchella sextelata]KAH0611703.1 hypothetical protein H6S33_010968 [Morchella sextelata]
MRIMSNTAVNFKFADRALAILNRFRAATAELGDCERKRMYQLGMMYLFQIAKYVDCGEHRNTPETSGRGIPKIRFLRFNYQLLDKLKNDIIIDLQLETEELEGAREFIALEEEMAPEVQRILRETLQGTDMDSSEPRP